MQLFSIKRDSFGQQVQAIADVAKHNFMAAVSPGGLFLAIIVFLGLARRIDQQYALQIYALASGRLLHTYRRHPGHGRID